MKLFLSIFGIITLILTGIITLVWLIFKGLMKILETKPILIIPILLIILSLIIAGGIYSSIKQ